MPDFPIIDTHVHLYDPAQVPFTWMKDVPKLNRPHMPADFDRASAGVQVDGMVFVEVDAAAGHHVDEAKWVSALARSDGRIRGMVASLPMENGAAVAGELAELKHLAPLRGVRRLIQGHVNEPGWCLRDPFVEAVQMLALHGLSFDICIFHPQMADAAELVRRCPDVQFVLDHIGKPGIKDGVMEPWATQMKALASLPNVVCKISGAVTEADHASWRDEQVLPYVAHAISSFGYDRVMFGGDWPVLSLAGTYAQWVGIVDKAVASATASEKRKLFRENAEKFYRL